jgi:hypothetical protein
MIEDIQKITKIVFDEFMDKELQNPKTAYSTYISLQKFIEDLALVADHYLALNFSEEYLQNSSLGTPADKWRTFFNEDLEKLNSSTKKYLMKLNNLGIKDEFHSILSNFYNPRAFYGFVRDKYNVGFVEPCGFDMICTPIDTNVEDNKTIYLSSFQRVELDSFTKRQELQTHLNNQKDKLKKELIRLKEYMLENYSIDVLL